MSYLYTLFFKRFSKKFIGFKNFYVSLNWSLLIPLLASYYFLPISSSVILVFLFVYLRLLLHEIFSDIKDIDTDKKENLQTFPITFDSLKIFYILNIINLFTSLPLVFGVYFGLLPGYSLILLFSLPYSFYYFKKSMIQKINNEAIYSVISDGEYILWSIFILIGKYSYDKFFLN